MKEHDESAFPLSGGGLVADVYGMTLRDWFAGQALMGYLADSNVTGAVVKIAAAAYVMADALLAERAK
jgi:hypothetical protein